MSSGSVRDRPARPLARVTLAELESDPYPTLHRLRAESPVAVCAELDALLVLRWADVATVVSGSRLFRSDQPDSFLTRFVGPNMLHSEGQDHRAARAAVLPAFRELGPAMRAEVTRRYAALRGSGAPCDLAAQLCVPVVATMTVDLLGCEDRVTPEEMARWGPLVSQGAFDFHAFGTDDGELADARARIAALAVDVAAGRRRARPDTVLGRLAGLAASADEIRRTVEFMIIGADAGPREGVSTVLACVLSADPAVRAGLVDSPAARQAFVDEALRWESPIGAVTREARVDTELAGVAVPQGTRVLGALGSANRDPARWPRPDAFIADRGDRAHLSFGAGMHGCIGAAITRRLADAVILAAAADPTIALRSAPEYRGWWYRGPAAIPVHWT